MRAAETNATSKPPAAGLVAEGLCEMRFPDTGGPLSEDRFVPFDKATGRQIEHLLAIDRGVKAEIESLQRLAEIDRRAPEPQLQLFLCAALDFVFDETLEEIDVKELLRDGLLRPDLQRGEDARQPEVFEFWDELMIQLHVPPPVEGKKSLTGRAKRGSVGTAAPGGGTAGACV
jgi:hypothetical protein